MITIGIVLAVAGGGLIVTQTELGEEVFASEKSQSELAKQADISESKAKEIATNEVSGEIMEQELEEEDNTLVYEFEIKTDKDTKEVEVDAKSGEVLSTSSEDDDEEDDNEESSEK